MFIRYNPDKFKGTKISQNKRQTVLLEWLRYCKTLKPKNETDFLRVIKLFYNGYREGEVKFEKINIYPNRVTST